MSEDITNQLLLRISIIFNGNMINISHDNFSISCTMDKHNSGSTKIYSRIFQEEELKSIYAVVGLQKEKTASLPNLNSYMKNANYCIPF